MVEEQRFGSDLKKIEKGVKAPDVRKFVGDDGAQLEFGESSERTDRE